MILFFYASTIFQDVHYVVVVVVVALMGGLVDTILIILSSIVLAETLFARQGIQVLCMLAWVLSGGNQNYGTNLRESFWSPGWIWVAGILMCQWCVNSYDTDGVATEDSSHATGGHWHTDLLLSQWNLSSSSPWIAASSSEFGSWKPTTDVEQVGKQFWAQAHHRSQIILFDIL